MEIWKEPIFTIKVDESELNMVLRALQIMKSQTEVNDEFNFPLGVLIYQIQQAKESL